MKPDLPPCILLTFKRGACERCGYVRHRPEPAFRFEGSVPIATEGYVYARCHPGGRLADRELDLARWQRLGRAK